jgi:hypothetical protein
MVVEKFVEGFENFKTLMESWPVDGKVINILFTGKKINGISWCPDCVAGNKLLNLLSHPFKFQVKKLPLKTPFKSFNLFLLIAEPFIKSAVDQYAGDSVFVTCDVGDRAYWKDINCPFRKDPDTHLQVIPTLIRWKNPQRLEGDQLLKDDLLQMFFEDDS